MAETQVTQVTASDIALDLKEHLTNTVNGRRHACNVYKFASDWLPIGLTKLLDEGWNIQHILSGAEQGLLGGTPKMVAIVYVTREVAVRSADA